ncbi:MAG TPA: regulatory protein RecX [Solirubrobacteraceae bacterium]|nr:regulatory protein RecX [Solirubrobacteraceae bacterium]
MLDTEAGLERALAIAYRYLNSRERTRAETSAHLQGKGIDERDTEQAIQALTDQGYLDDARFARLFVQDKRELEQWGTDRIRQALRRRGVDPEAAEAALAEHDQDHGHDRCYDSKTSEIDRALAILRQRFPSPSADRRERERALAVLLRKGYDSDLALEAIAAHSRDVDAY